MGFMPSNVCDESLINPCYNLKADNYSTLMCDGKTRLITKVNADHGDILVQGF